jgi:hypothetical protein
MTTFTGRVMQVTPIEPDAAGTVFETNERDRLARARLDGSKAIIELHKSNSRRRTADGRIDPLNIGDKEGGVLLIPEIGARVLIKRSDEKPSVAELWTLEPRD